MVGTLPIWAPHGNCGSHWKARRRNGSSSGADHAGSGQPGGSLAQAQMMRDLTLIIPTCNRAPSLAALMGYLETEKADCRVLVLDSSHPETMAANRARVGTSSL